MYMPDAQRENPGGASDIEIANRKGVGPHPTLCSLTDLADNLTICWQIFKAGRRTIQLTVY